jgi:hypothetical protein
MRERNWDGYAAVIASLIGLLALLVSGYTAYLQRQQVRAMVWPSLQVATALLSHKFYASNNGMGPARVTGVKLEVDGKLMKTWVEAIRSVGHDRTEGYAFSSLNGRVLPPGDKVEVYDGHATEASRALYDVIFRDHGISMLVCYCSVLDQCWVAGYGLRYRIDVRNPASCPITDSEQFSN